MVKKKVGRPKKTDSKPKVYKKRGRKPKGGKIIAKNIVKVITEKSNTPNIILHLKCSSKELRDKYYNENSPFNPIDTFTLLNWEDINNNTKPSADIPETTELPNKIIWRKLKQLENKLHINDISDKKSNCFWCTYSFDNPPHYIPRQERNNIIEVYGCFCSPECACAYLTMEHIDSSLYWERFALLNNIYGKIYNYEENIKPAPNPHHTLNKFYGNLTIQEYRKLLKNDRLLIVVDKPLTKILPELHNEKNEIPSIYKNVSITKKNLGIHYRLKRKEPKYTKNNILNSTFNFK